MKKHLLMFLTGGASYCILEMLWRGRTHISMFLAGGTCLCRIDHLCNRILKKRCLLIKCAAGAAVITCVEFFTGLLVNKKMKLKVWDYSRAPMNVLGQVCLPYSLLWMALTLPALGVCRLFDRKSKNRLKAF